MTAHDPAFPIEGGTEWHTSGKKGDPWLGKEFRAYPGLTKRELLAGLICAGMRHSRHVSTEVLARHAVEHADALLAALAEKNDG
jgi:hypothetical protein